MVWPELVWLMSISPQLPPIPLAQASAVLRAMAQSSGQTVDARVMGQLPNGMTQVQIGRQVMSLQLPMPQPPGTTLTLAVQQAEGQVRVALVSAQPPGPSSAPPAPQVSAPNVPATSVQLSAAALSGQAGAPASTVPVSNPASAGSAQPAPGAAPQQVVSPAVPASAPVAMPQVSTAAAASGASATPVQTGALGQAPAGERAAPPPVAVAASASAAMRPAVPYAVAAQAIGPGAMPVPSNATTTTLPPVAQPVVAGNVGQHAPPPNAGPSGSTAPALPPASAPPVPAAASPQAAVTQMVQQALPRQDSVVALTTALTQVVARVALPEPVMKAVQQVLGQRLSLDGGGPDGAALQKAVRNSGIFQEAMLANGQARAAGGDMKTALLGLQRELGAWLGDQAGVEQVRAIPPPLRGMVPRARVENMSLGDLPEDAQAAGKVLLERTEAALSRLRLHQNASLPEPAARHEAQWSLDLPVMVSGQQSLLHMQIHRDRDGDGPEQNEDRGWQVRFAINLSDMGEVGAQISLRGNATGVLLWADREETAALLNAGIGLLRQDLEALSLAPGAIVVRAGAPSAAVPPTQSAGHIVDAVR